MTFLKNIQFSHLIKIDTHLKEFNFRKSNGNLETIFTVDTLDARNDRIIFNMYNTGTDWKIKQSGLPSWIMENEMQLNKSIQQELAIQEVYFVKPTAASPKQFSRFFNLFGIS
ncbi:MAG: hypothetical protein ABIN36_02275 [Ferruginibacter sp.]